MKFVSLMLLMALVSASSLRAEESELFDPATGMRISHYRAAVPPDVKGGKRIDIDELDEVLAKEKPLLLDVMPSEGPGADPATGQWSIPKTHDHIPGSTWLPDVGRGRVTPALECYFRQNLVRLTGGDKAKPIVLYCQSDCWMAWNAVRRAAGYGYTRLYWYPDGIDGWRDWERKAEPAVPVPLDPKCEDGKE